MGNEGLSGEGFGVRHERSAGWGKSARAGDFHGADERHSGCKFGSGILPGTAIQTRKVAAS